MRIFILLLLLVSVSSYAGEVRRYSGTDEVIQADIELVLKKAGWTEGKVTFTNKLSDKNSVEISCHNGRIYLDTESVPHEKVSTIYHGLFKLGFLFPHPRMQISPTENEALSKCGKTFVWRPAFKYRGFHLHTLHPNEWVKGFLQGDKAIALDTVRWNARNRQNVIQLTLLRPGFSSELKYLKEPFALAKALGITRGVSNGAALQQQNHWAFIPFLNAVTGVGAEKKLRSSLKMLNEKLDFDFYSMEFGTSEFTAVNYERALSWMKITDKIAKEQGKMLFGKIHVSTNQHHATYGNFNFLVRYAPKEIGLFPHTVMFYGLYDEKVPMYGNENFSHLLKFIQEEKSSRNIWYFPETSYWIGMDMDVPLLLTDYLNVRARDMKGLNEEGIEGHVTFSTGQEIGYWLFDWNLTLNTDLDQNFDPKSGLKLLKEDMSVWNEILDFQNKHFKKNQVIASISATNIQDEIAPGHKIHERNIMKSLEDSDILREGDILKLQNAIAELPSITGIKNDELKKMLEVTHLRLHHALAVRMALRHPKKSDERMNQLKAAVELREKAFGIMKNVRETYSRYPEAHLWERRSDPTAYSFGYLWTSGTMHFWKREEEQVRNANYNPFYMNIYNILDILL
jgi:hypothetical protein